MEKKKIKRLLQCLVKPITVSLGWWETQPQSSPQVSMGQGEFGSSSPESVSHVFFFLALENVCTLSFITGRLGRLLGSQGCGNSGLSPESPPCPTGLHPWLGFPLLWYSFGSVESTNIGHMRTSFTDFCRFKYHQYHYLLNVFL